MPSRHIIRTSSTVLETIISVLYISQPGPEIALTRQDENGSLGFRFPYPSVIQRQCTVTLPAFIRNKSGKGFWCKAEAQFLNMKVTRSISTRNLDENIVNTMSMSALSRRNDVVPVHPFA